MKNLKGIAILAALAFLMTTSVFAATATSNMSVSASVSTRCTISAGALAFGSYDPVVDNASSALDGSAALTVACTNGSSAVITLGQGSNAAGGSSDADPLRRLNSGSNFLNYSLFADAGFSTAWGNTAGTGQNYTGVGTDEVVTVYGRIAGGQNVPAGSYSDTVVATITF